MRPLTCDLLEKTVGKLSPKISLEIGTSLGVSAMTVLASCDTHLTTIDIDENVIKKAKVNINSYGFNKRCNFLNGDCHEIVRLMKGYNKYDFILLDGPKGHYYELFQNLIEMLDIGGIIFIDDINYYGLIESGANNKKHRTIIKNLRKLTKCIAEDNRIEAKKYDIEDGVMIVKKVRNEELTV